MAPRFGILHKGEMHQVIAFGELVVPIAVAVVHQTPTAANEGEYTGGAGNGRREQKRSPALVARNAQGDDTGQGRSYYVH